MAVVVRLDLPRCMMLFVSVVMLTVTQAEVGSPVLEHRVSRFQGEVATMSVHD